jgi:hypothetical protein
MKKKQPATDIVDQVHVLSGIRKEVFPFEKYVALFTFTAWMNFPNDPAVVTHARVMAVAQVYLWVRDGALGRKKSSGQALADTIFKRALVQDELARAVAARPFDFKLQDHFDLNLRSISIVSDIFAAVVRCPVNRRPSLNVAFYLVTKGAFIPEDQPPTECENRISLTTAKDDWSRFAVASPFFWTSFWMENELYELAVDGEAVLKKAKAFINNQSGVQEYFANAAFFQKILSLLGPKISARSKFLKFNHCEIAEPLIDELDPKQVAVMEGYSFAKLNDPRR